MRMPETEACRRSVGERRLKPGTSLQIMPSALLSVALEPGSVSCPLCVMRHVLYALWKAALFKVLSKESSVCSLTCWETEAQHIDGNFTFLLFWFYCQSFVSRVVASISPLPVQDEEFENLVMTLFFLVPSYRQPLYCKLPHKAA